METPIKLLPLLFGTLLLSHCAQTAPPVPPSLELPKPVTDLRATRKGDKVFLRWTVPTQTLDGESVRALGPTRICRGFDSNMSNCDFSVAEVKSTLPIVEKSKTEDALRSFMMARMKGLLEGWRRSGGCGQ